MNTTKRGVFSAFLGLVERIGNLLPDQITIFAILATLTLFLSWWAASAGFSVNHPVTGEAVAAINLLNREGLQWIFGHVVSNFTGFAPLGTVLVAMIGIGVAERTGLFAALLKGFVASVPRWAITPTIIFAGINSNVASDAGYVILPPLAAMTFASLGRNPVVGIAAAFAGIGAGFSANLMLSTLDPMLAGLTQEAARLFDPKYEVNAAANYYFMAVCVFLLTLVGWFVSDRIVEPYCGPWSQAIDQAIREEEFGTLKPKERRGLIVAAIVFVITCLVILLLVLPGNAILRNSATGDLKPFYNSLVALILIVFVLPGIAYGLVVGNLRSDRDAARMMTQTIATMAHYIVLAFFAGQFIAWFGKSKLGFILAIEGAAFLKSVHLTGIPLVIAFVLVTATFNLLMSSASAKWALLAPIFVPMFMALGVSPEMTQGTYRIGDSVTNVITPLNFYFPLLLAAAHRYFPKYGMGNLIAAMLPYSIAFLIGWTVLIIIWVQLGIPLGPSAPLTYTMPI